MDKAAETCGVYPGIVQLQRAQERLRRLKATGSITLQKEQEGGLRQGGPAAGAEPGTIT